MTSLWFLIKSLPHGDVKWRRGSWSSLVPEIVCRLFGAKPLPDQWCLYSVKLESKYNRFPWTKCIKIYSTKCQHFCSGLSVLIYYTTHWFLHHSVHIWSTWARPITVGPVTYWSAAIVAHRAAQWRHNERDGVSNHQSHDCLLKRLFMRWSKKASKLRVTGLQSWGKFTGDGWIPRTKGQWRGFFFFIWWRHHELT